MIRCMWQLAAATEASLSWAPYRNFGCRAEVDRLKKFRRFAPGKQRRQTARSTLNNHVSIKGYLANRQVVNVAVQ